MRRRLGSTFQSLGVRNYRLFAIGQLISLIFGWVQITAQDWLVLQLSHNSPSALGVVTAFQFTPILLLTLYGGKLADRFDKRRLLFVVNGLLYLVLAGLMGVAGGRAARSQLWQVFVFAVLWGTVTAIETPIRQSFVSELVDRPLLPNALGAVRGHLQLRPDHRPGRRRAVDRDVRYRYRVRGQRAVLHRAAGRAVPDAPRRAVPRRAAVGRAAAADARVTDGLRYVAAPPGPAAAARR